MGCSYGNAKKNSKNCPQESIKPKNPRHNPYLTHEKSVPGVPNVICSGCQCTQPRPKRRKNSILYLLKHQQDIFLLIFDYLSLGDLFRVFRVCIFFYNLTGDSSLLQKFQSPSRRILMKIQAEDIIPEEEEKEEISGISVRKKREGIFLSSESRGGTLIPESSSVISLPINGLVIDGDGSSTDIPDETTEQKFDIIADQTGKYISSQTIPFQFHNKHITSNSNSNIQPNDLLEFIHHNHIQKIPFFITKSKIYSEEESHKHLLSNLVNLRSYSEREKKCKKEEMYDIRDDMIINRISFPTVYLGVRDRKILNWRSYNTETMIEGKQEDLRRNKPNYQDTPKFKEIKLLRSPSDSWGVETFIELYKVSSINSIDNNCLLFTVTDSKVFQNNIESSNLFVNIRNDFLEE